jgi:hypothetical protein
MQEMFPMCFQEPRIRETVSSSKKHQEAAVFFHTTEVLHTPGKPHNLANSAGVNNCDTRNRLQRVFQDMTKGSTPDATISSDLEKHLLSNLLDISGESHYQDLYEGVTQVLAYMQQHR